MPRDHHEDGYSLDDVITSTDGGSTTVGDLVRRAFWYDTEPGQTTDGDTLRLHLLSEHGDCAALGLTDEAAVQRHAARHTYPAGHGKDRVGWDHDRITARLLDVHDGTSVSNGDDAATLTARWNAHYMRITNGGLSALPAPAPVANPDPAVWDADTDEMTAAVLAGLAEMRRRLAADLAWHPQMAQRVVGAVDEYAYEIVEQHLDHDADTEEEADHDG